MLAQEKRIVCECLRKHLPHMTLIERVPSSQLSSGLSLCQRFPDVSQLRYTILAPYWTRHNGNQWQMIQEAANTRTTGKRARTTKSLAKLWGGWEKWQVWRATHHSRKPIIISFHMRGVLLRPSSFRSPSRSMEQQQPRCHPHALELISTIADHDSGDMYFFRLMRGEAGGDWRVKDRRGSLRHRRPARMLPGPSCVIQGLKWIWLEPRGSCMYVCGSIKDVVRVMC